MNKEPLGLYIFRYVLGFALFAFMCMLYWSSVLIEENIGAVRSDIGQLKNDVYNLRDQTEKIREDVLKSIIEHQNNLIHNGINLKEVRQEEKKSEVASAKTLRPHIDPSLPNLLTEDPFYQKTLPELLGKNFVPKGTLHAAMLTKPDNLHPFNNYADIRLLLDRCVSSASRSKFGIYETMAPDLAIKIEERPLKDDQGVEYWIHLRDGVYWDPLTSSMFNGKVELAPHFLRKHQVTAEDFKFWYDAMMNPYNQERGALAIRSIYDGLEEVRVIDKLTFVARWKTETVKVKDGKEIKRVRYAAKLLTGGLIPLPSFVFKYFADGTKIIEDDNDPNSYRTNSVWANNFSQHWAKNIIVGCGPWTFDGMTDRQIKFIRNQNFYSPLAALIKDTEIVFKNTIESMWQDFKSNKLDTYAVQPEQLIELDTFLKSPTYKSQEASGQKINRLDYIATSYFYIGWNQAKPFFKSKKVRQAMTMAIDRERIIRQTLNGMGVLITGPFYVTSPSNDASIRPWPYDPEHSKQLLQEEGWYDSDGDGIIDKEIDGKRVPFRFTLKYFVKNQIAKSICEYVATSLKEIGIECHLHGVDVADLSTTIEDRLFDALYMGWGNSTPPEDPKQLWFSAGATEKGSSNYVGFSNQEADKIIIKLQFEDDREKRLELYHRFHRIIHDEQPYTFIYTPKVALLYRERVQNVFIPAERQDLIPGANIGEPDSSIYWLKE